jgi:hypothetical protein
MILIYCKTVDDPKEVVGYVCKSNFGEKNSETKSRVINDGSEDDCWIIETDRQNETSAMIYRISHEIVVIEIDDNCASNVIEPLMKKYGFDNIKWLLTK